MNTKNVSRIAVRSTVAALAVGSLAFATAGTASAATADSYSAKTVSVTVGTDIGAHVYASGNCSPGYHVRGGYEQLIHTWIPDVSLDVDSSNTDMHWDDPIAYNQNGGDNEMEATYQGFAVAVYNHSWKDDETTRVNFTCDRN